MGKTVEHIDIVTAGAVTPEKIRACLEAIGRADPLIVPPRSGSMIGQYRIACIEDQVVGIGSLYHRAGKAEIDVRVRPEFRRKGVGSALFDVLTADIRTALHAGCDGAQRGAQAFLERRDFTLTGVLFAQRWDGAPEDVPPAFSSVQLQATRDYELTQNVLGKAYADSWFMPAIGAEDFDRDDINTWLAYRDGIPVGAAVARRSDDTVWIAGLGSLPTERRLGVGRAMLCQIMSLAAEENCGVVLLTPAEDEQSLRWTRKLGFWSYRSWSQYMRVI